MSITFSEPIAFAVECHQKGDFAEAERVYRDLLVQNPANADALHLLGMLANDTKQPEIALGHIGRAIQMQPEISYYHSNLGNVLQQLGRYDDAELCYREALRLQPDLAEAHNNRGNALSALERGPEAVGCFLEALKLKPGYHEAFGNLGRALLNQGHWEDAIACYTEARRLEPGFSPYVGGLAWVLGNWGDHLAQQGDHGSALACYESALELAPDDPDLHVWLAHSLLITGQFERGWKEFEWRWRLQDNPNVNFAQPLWDGSPLAGKRILLWAEQGLGDTIQFVRFAECVKRAGGTVVVECQPALERLLANCPWIDEVIAFGSPLPDFHVHAPMQSLPHILRTTAETFPTQLPYLAVDPKMVQACRNELSGSALRVGLAWAGSPDNKNDGKRSIPAEKLASLKRIDGVEWFSLQKEDLPGDFAEAAALIENLDLVITVDTAAAHLAGALGKPVWNLLPFSPDYRWLLDREDSPWYPTMRLFRQTVAGDWDSVLARVGEALESVRNEHRD